MASPASLDDLRGPLLVALLTGDAPCAEETLAEAASRGASLALVARDLVTPAMAEVGEMWAAGRLSEAEEHLASALVASTLLRKLPAVAAPRPGAPRIVLACLPGEFHDLGVRIAAEVARAAGWEAELLGANVPRRAALAFLAERAPSTVGLSVTLSAHLPECGRMVDELRQRSPRTRILLGGRALRKDPAIARAVLAGGSSRGGACDACILDAVQLETWLKTAHPGPCEGLDAKPGLPRALRHRVSRSARARSPRAERG